jgi:hypothetical protein
LNGATEATLKFSAKRVPNPMPFPSHKGWSSTHYAMFAGDNFARRGILTML